MGITKQHNFGQSMPWLQQIADSLKKFGLMGTLLLQC